MTKAIGLALVVFLLAHSPSAAQVGDVPLPYPGWQPQDGARPHIEVTEQYDPGLGRWHYDYTVTNEPEAVQDIWTIDIRVGAWVSRALAPNGWGPLAPKEARWNPSGPGIPVVLFLPELPQEFEGNYWSASPYQIPPGQTLTGFSIESPYPPGYSRTYIQGYAQVPFPPDPEIDPDAYYAMNRVPDDTTNSQRGWTLGPMIYDRVLTTGDDGLTTDNFLGWMNISDFATILIDPAPIAVKFSVVGETVFPETFRAELNGVDVTAAFLPGPPDGADRVAVFRLGSSPLVEGVNVIQTSIEGIEAFTGVRGVDVDVMRFRLDPACRVPQTIVCVN